MSRASLLFLLSMVLAAPLAGCSKKDKGTTNPDEATEAEGEVDPLAELQAIPGQVQAEVDLVLQPITDVDVVIDQVTSMPETLGVDPASLRGLAKASLENGEVAVSLDVTAEAKAEVEAVLVKITGIVTGLQQTPERVKTATGNIVAIGTKATALVSKLTAKYQAKLSNPLLKAEAKAKIQADLDTVLELDADIKATISDAKQTVTSLPNKGKEALVKLTAAFSGAASADAG
jgi:hypothetical protein